MRKSGFEQYQDQISRFISIRRTIERRGVDKDLPHSALPKTVTFQITDDCNLRCTYCYQINKGKRVMDFETAKNFIELLIADSYKNDTYVSLETTPGVIIEFIGGEPLLEIDLIDKIVDYFRFRLIQENHPWASVFLISMISNGVLYFDERVQNFIRKNKAQLSFSISLDGCKPLHDMCRVFPDGTGSYDLAEAGCIHYKTHYDSNMLTKMTIAPENITWTYEAFLNLIRLGYKTIHANCVYESGWTVNHAIVLYSELKKIADYIIDNDLEESVICTILEENACKPQIPLENQNYCGSTGCMLCCDPDGVIAPCVRFLKSSLGEKIGDFALGTVTDGIGIKEEHKTNINTLDRITRRSQSTDECFDCPVSQGCGWCTALNYQETGTPDKRCTYICWMHRARSLATVYYWNKVYQKSEHDKDRVFKLYLPREIALEIISEEEYDMLIELAGGFSPEDNYKEFMEKESEKYIPGDDRIEGENY